MTPLRIDTSASGAVGVARIHGEIDLANAARIATEIPERLADDSAALIVDLAAVPYVDSAGVRALFQLINSVTVRGLAVALVVPHASQIARLLKLTRIDEAAAVASTLEEALAALALEEQ